MNKQKAPKGIEWTRINGRPGYTWNVVGGCKHACEWKMPDGSVAVCYAKTVAEKFSSAYPNGFEYDYWHPERLNEPLKIKEPAGIFIDSMADLMGSWVSDDHIREVLSIVKKADWHVFQLLTKNAPRLLKFKDELPLNLWIGVSMPPSSFMGKELIIDQQMAFIRKTLSVLSEIKADDRIRWMSFEPLSFDVAFTLARWGTDHWNIPLEWAVIGAASNGMKYYQPDSRHVVHLLDVLDRHDVPVFFKGNLKWSIERKEFPNERTTE